MGKSLEAVLAGLSTESKKKVAARAQELREEFETLRDLRKAQKLTQVKMADRLGIKQENVSRVEQRSDMYISTLRKYLVTMGGDLRLVVDFPHRAPVELTKLGMRMVEGKESPKWSLRKRSTSKAKRPAAAPRGPRSIGKSLPKNAAKHPPR